MEIFEAEDGFGPKISIRAFQVAGTLSVDGIAGPQTWSASITEVSEGSELLHPPISRA